MLWLDFYRHHGVCSPPAVSSSAKASSSHKRDSLSDWSSLSQADPSYTGVPHVGIAQLKSPRPYAIALEQTVLGVTSRFYRIDQSSRLLCCFQISELGHGLVNESDIGFPEQVADTAWIRVVTGNGPP
jgi:hypothetical protein